MSEKKKHHSFRVNLPAREVMRRLQDYTSTRETQNIDIHKIDIHGYDFTYRRGLSRIRISFREDSQSEDTIVFVEHNGSKRNEDMANDVEFIVNEKVYLRKPIIWSKLTQSLERLFGISIYETVIDVSPRTFINTLKQLQCPIGKVEFGGRDIPGIYDLEFLHADSTSQTSDFTTTFYVYKGETPDQTRLTYAFGDASAYGCYGFYALISGLGSILLGVAILFSTSLEEWTQAIILFGVSIFAAYITIKMIRNKRHIHHEFDTWLTESLQAISEQDKNELTEQDSLRLHEADAQSETKQNHDI